MKKSSLNQLATARQRQTGGAEAFTLTELLVVMGVIAMLAVVLLSAAFTTQERVLRAQCVSNLRQIATGWNLYQQDFNQVMPCHWPGFTDTHSTSNPWRTYEAGRVTPGTLGWSADTDPPNLDGPWNLGVLFATGLVPNPRVFYCPSTARIDSQRTYDYYAAVSNSWPSTSPSSTEVIVRTGYNYYPQLRATELISAGQRGPKPARTPAKWTDLDPKKSIATDLVLSSAYWSHKASGSVAGLNALFPDGRVVFQNARSNPQAFDHALWDDPNGSTADGARYVGNDPFRFRVIMSLWQP